MIAILCDVAPCQKRAVYRVTYDRTQVPIDVCRDHTLGPVDMSLLSGGDLHVTLIPDDRVGTSTT